MFKASILKHYLISVEAILITIIIGLWVMNLQIHAAEIGITGALPSPTHAAGSTPDGKIAEWLAKQPISVNETLPEKYQITEGWVIEKGANLMSIAAAQGRVDVMEWLAKQGLSPTDKDFAGEQPLFHAAYMNQVEVLNWLKNNGTDLTARDNNKDTAVHEAALGGSVDALQWLKNNGADLTARDNNKGTAVHKAALRGSVDALQWLKNNGANLSAKNAYGWTAVHIAALEGQVAVLQWLKNNNIDLNAQDETGKTAVIMAALASRTDALQWFKNNGANLNAQGNPKMPILHWVAYFGEEPSLSLEWLRKNGANLNAKDNDGAMAMQIAARSGNIDAMKWLKKNGADLNARDNSGWTAVHAAAYYGHVPAMQWLKDNGADLTAQINSGWTAEEIAEKEGHDKATRWLANSCHPLYQRAIKQVLTEGRRLKVINGKLPCKDENEFYRISTNYTQSLRKLDLAKCPRDFREAFIRYIVAEETFTPVGKQLVTPGFFNTLYNAFLLEHNELQLEVSRAWEIVEEIADDYDVH